MGKLYLLLLGGKKRRGIGRGGKGEDKGRGEGKEDSGTEGKAKALPPNPL